MPRFRKLPIEIEAMQWDGSTQSADDIEAWSDHMTACRALGTPVMLRLMVFTLEGEMWAMPGDWIIKGVHGEFYPCKPDIFAKTYEQVSE